ncbi:hypothetical protein [Microbacterium allomyrinae]|uniref:Uncharacterized protein n=1 Tax=Microbacterium allomyrinae TaxID=2830666 RepID=A0A9X1LVY1_9MICO|nr:hypothetical protein [Microbacterium allomyrinae]MCC2033055.1 hypothetical protein [Microbacterium allomyrinae]
MTVVTLNGLETMLGAPGPMKRGKVQVDYWAGARAVTRVDGADVTFPSQITVAIADGSLVEVLDLPATGGVCCVRIVVSSGGKQLIRFVEIPASGPVDFGNLVDVDPGTFAPLDPTPPNAQQVLEEAASALGSAAAAAAARAAAETAQSAAEAAAASVIPSTDAAMAAAAGAPGSVFAAQQAATFVRFVDHLTGESIDPAGTVVIKVNVTTGDIDDIVFEEA